MSYYSNAGGEVYGNYPVSGEILFGIKYDPKIQEFQVQIHQGRDITAADKKTETSDPYVFKHYSVTFGFSKVVLRGGKK